MIKVFIVHSRLGSDLLSASAHLTLKEAQDVMKAEYKDAIDTVKGDGDKIDFRRCGRREATVASFSDWYEWRITESLMKEEAPKKGYFHIDKDTGKYSVL